MSSSMYTGLNSGTLKVREQREVVKIEKETLRAKILPAYEQLAKDLDAEIARMSDISTIVDGKYVAEDEMRFELAARKRYVDLLRNLKSKYERAIKDES